MSVSIVDNFDDSEDWRDWHILTVAETGFSALMAYACDDIYGLEPELISQFADRVNGSNESGSLHPKASISALPKKYFRDIKEDDVPGHINDFKEEIKSFIKANQQKIKSSRVLVDFRVSADEVSRHYIDAVVVLLNIAINNGHLTSAVVIRGAHDKQGFHSKSVQGDNEAKSREYFQACTNGWQRLPFEWCVDNDGLSIYRQNGLVEEFNGEQLVEILQELRAEFGFNPDSSVDTSFALANNVARLGKDDAPRGLGRTMYLVMGANENPNAVRYGQCASYLSVVFYLSGIFGWNECRHGARYWLALNLLDWDEVRERLLQSNNIAGK